MIEHLPSNALEKLDKKAKASGRSLKGEAAAILASSEDIELTTVDDVNDVQRMVWEAYRGKLPRNAVEELLAERRLEAKVEAEKLV